MSELAHAWHCEQTGDLYLPAPIEGGVTVEKGKTTTIWLPARTAEMLAVIQKTEGLSRSAAVARAVEEMYRRG